MTDGQDGMLGWTGDLGIFLDKREPPAEHCQLALNMVELLKLL